MMEAPLSDNTDIKGFPVLTLSDIGSAYKYGYANGIIFNLLEYLPKHPHADWVAISILPGKDFGDPIDVTFYPNLNILDARYAENGFTFQVTMQDASRLINTMDLLVARAIRRPIMLALNARVYQGAHSPHGNYANDISEIGECGHEERIDALIEAKLYIKE